MVVTLKNTSGDLFVRWKIQYLLCPLTACQRDRGNRSLRCPSAGSGHRWRSVGRPASCGLRRRSAGRPAPARVGAVALRICGKTEAGELDLAAARETRQLLPKAPTYNDALSVARWRQLLLQRRCTFPLPAPPLNSVFTLTALTPSVLIAQWRAVVHWKAWIHSFHMTYR